MMLQVMLMAFQENIFKKSYVFCHGIGLFVQSHIGSYWHRGEVLKLTDACVLEKNPREFQTKPRVARKIWQTTLGLVQCPPRDSLPRP